MHIIPNRQKVIQGRTIDEVQNTNTSTLMVSGITRGRPRYRKQNLTRSWSLWLELVSLSLSSSHLPPIVSIPKDQAAGTQNTIALKNDPTQSNPSRDACFELQSGQIKSARAREWDYGWGSLRVMKRFGLGRVTDFLYLGSC